MQFGQSKKKNAKLKKCRMITKVMYSFFFFLILTCKIVTDIISLFRLQLINIRELSTLESINIRELFTPFVFYERVLKLIFINIFMTI